MDKTIIFRVCGAILLILAIALSGLLLSGWDPMPAGYMTKQPNGLSWIEWTAMPVTNSLSGNWEIVLSVNGDIVESSGVLSGTKEENAINFTMHREPAENFYGYGDLVHERMWVSDYSDGRTDAFRTEYIKTTREVYQQAKLDFIENN